MPKKVCPNGHVYDSSIYGEECPLCPKGNEAAFGASAQGFDAEVAGGTHINPPASDNMGNVGGNTGGFQRVNVHPMGMQDASGETKLRRNAGGNQGGAKPGATMIRPPKGNAKTNGRKLVGFLVTYNRYPLGKSYEIYEGKNFIGRDSSCDIVIPDDGQISGRHLMILYRNVDNKFKYHDEQSSNGSFINKELSDEGELQNYDIIRLGNTVFIFMAIPQV